MRRTRLYRKLVIENKLKIHFVFSLFSFTVFLANQILGGRIMTGILAVAVFLYTLIILIANYLVYIRDGGIHRHIYTLIYDNIDEMKIKNIATLGTGNGELTLNIAKRYINVSFTEIGFWRSNDLMYKCQDNAILNGVFERVKFINEDPKKLQLDDNTFDAIISCFAFNEICDATNSFDIIRESIRILRPHGQLIFIDFFKDKKIYGEYSIFVDNLKNIGIDVLEISDISSKIVLPSLLRNNKFLGNAQIIVGKKSYFNNLYNS